MRSHLFQLSVVPMRGVSARLNGWVKILMVPYLWSLLCSSAMALPCLESSETCLTQLTAQAIRNSSEIEAINQRLELTDDRIDYAEARQWTDYITLDPLRLVQNIFGGGDVQRNRLAIANLEIQSADLIRRREEVAEGLAREVIDLVLEYEAADRHLETLQSQIATQASRQAVMEASYRTGAGSTTTMLGVWQRTEDLEARYRELEIQQGQTIRELEVLCDAGKKGHIASASGSSAAGWRLGE